MKNTLLISLLIVSMPVYSQQQLTITSSRENNYCNGTCTLIDAAGLNGNPTAVIFITPVEVNGVNLDPHPICAYYTGKQWSVLNVDNSTMPPGSQFHLKYYSTPDNDHFTHIVTKENLVKNNSYIDHDGLNGNPNAKVELFQNAAPNIRGGLFNKDGINLQYDEAAGKWYISSSKDKALDYATGYNISIIARSNNSNAITISTPPGTTTTTPFTPGTKTDNSGQRVFVSVVGKTQGAFPGENMSSRIEVTGFEMEMNSPRDLATGMSSGKRQHFPVSFQKASGAASTEFFKAFTVNEVLNTVTFEVYKPSAAGNDVLSYKIVLTNAAISNFKQSFAEGQKGFVDSIKLTFQAIAISSGGVTVSENWQVTN